MTAPSANAIPLTTPPWRAKDIAASRLRALSCRGIDTPICEPAHGLPQQQCRVGATAFKSLLLSTIAADAYGRCRPAAPVAVSGIVLVTAATLFVRARVGCDARS